MKIMNLPSGPLMVNTYLVIDEDTKKGFIVDPGGHNPRLTTETNKEDVKIEYIILTHGHGDHIGGVKAHLADFPGARVIAHEAELPMLSSANVNMSTSTLGQSVTIEPDIAVKDGDTLDVGNMHLQFIHTPGHTPGGQCILVGEVLFSGDTLFNQSVGRTDFPGGSFDDLLNAIRHKLFILPNNTKVLPGHMGPTEIGYEKEHNPFV